MSHSAVTSIFRARRHDGGYLEFPLDVGATYAELRGGLVGEGVPVVVDDVGQLGNVWDDLGAFISIVPLGVAAL
jgi:hypothetical protein